MFTLGRAKTRRVGRWQRWLGLVVAGSLALTGCDRVAEAPEEPATSPPTAPETIAPPPETAPPAPAT
ncbi:MAG: hypothetical protein HC929_23715, partial [Leptolyngbyaceae cyanobacterium SM2_5_2]|nr:hypothetical protein [Leptolyngbyaceae cyanobacterium SM2_5_2]